MNAVARFQRALKSEAKRAEREAQAAIESLATAHAERLTSATREHDHLAALQRLSAALSRLSAAADLSGRVEILSRSRETPVPEEFALQIPDEVPAVPFAAAIEDLESRDPFGAEALKSAGLEVEHAYGAVRLGDGSLFYAHGFALAKAADAEVAARVKDRLVSGLREGTPTPKIVQQLVTEWDWPSAYAETVVRTTFNTATTAGRFREAEKVNRAGIPIALRFETAGDANVRSGRPQDNGENHAALDGFVARVDDPVWDKYSPPGGFSCRCVAVPTFDDVPDSFRSPPIAARFAPGFGRRPSRSGAYR